MKVTLLMAQCTSALLRQSVKIVTNVLHELEVEIIEVELHRLPYFEGKRTQQMDRIMSGIKESTGVIAISAVPMLGMHGSMQSFFDNATNYEMENFDKPMLAITYSEWLGEQEAAQMMNKCWNVLGGVEGGSIYLNKALPEKLVLERLEKEVENFYRLIKQERPNIGSSERVFYYNMKQKDKGISTPNKGSEMKKNASEIKSFAELVREETFVNRVDLTTKEQTIREIANLIDKETKGENFKSINSGVYTRPPQIVTVNNGIKRLQQIPHYFVAQYDKSLELVLKYQVTDIDETGYIIIKDGDCNFVEQIESLPTVEMILTEEVLINILSKKMTYQKAFMLGKLKVKGNFSILSKLDQIFKAL